MGIKKEKLIKKFLKTEVEVGQRVSIKGLHYKEDKVESHIISSLNPPSVEIYGYNEPVKFSLDQIVERSTRHIGVNPFPEKKETVRMISFSLYSILNSIGWEKERTYEKTFGFKMPDLNWNPYIIKNGEKEYYQRDFVWKLKDKQLLLESIYNGVECGKIIIRRHSWDYLLEQSKKGNKEIAFKDVVDGKQRLNAILGFVKNEYPDGNGKFFEDFSEIAVNRFLDHQLFSYGEMPETSTDEDVVRTFLMINHTGKSQSKEHINFVKTLL